MKYWIHIIVAVVVFGIGTAVTTGIFNEDQEKTSNDCSCANKPTGCETMRFEQPRAYCAAWTNEKGRKMNCCVVSMEE